MTNGTIHDTRAAVLRVQRDRERSLLQRDLTKVAARATRVELMTDELENLLSSDDDPTVLLRITQGAEMTVYHLERGCGQLSPSGGRQVLESRALGLGLSLCRFCASSLGSRGVA